MSALRRPRVVETLRARARARLLTAVSGDPAGTAPWVLALAEGEDRGLFAEDGAAWTVHAGTGTLVAGIRALLLQALHPGAMAGVHDHSRYREDTAGRLAGTVRWVLTMTYASRGQVERELTRVSRFHARVNGTYEGADASPRAYSANDRDLVEWVHIAFADAFLTAQEHFGTAIPGGPDAYVREWALAGELMGAADPPTTAAALRARIAGLAIRGELRGDERVREVVRFLRRPPFGRASAPAYRLLFAGAVATIPREYRRMLGVRRLPLPVLTATRVLVRLIDSILGDGPRAPDYARARLRRLDALGVPTRG